MTALGGDRSELNGLFPMAIRSHDWRVQALPRHSNRALHCPSN